MTEQTKYVTDLSVPDVDKDRYLIYNSGKVYDTKSNRFLKIMKDDEGYSRIYFHTSSGFLQRYLHRVVKIEFDGFDTDPLKNTVDHKDCDKDNNWIWNLEWVTSAENARRAIDNGLYSQFDVKMNEQIVETICMMLSQGKTYQEISDSIYNLTNQNTVGIVGKIYRGERWTNISKKYMPFPPLNKSYSIPKTSVLTKPMIHEICQHLQDGKGIMETARLIQSKYNLDADLEGPVSSIKHRKSYKYISCDYNFEMEENNMPKGEKPIMDNFEESIKNYGSKIEHIDSFVEAIRRFPGKDQCTAWLSRNTMI